MPLHLAELLDTAWQADPTVLRREPTAKACKSNAAAERERKLVEARALFAPREAVR